MFTSIFGAECAICSIPLNKNEDGICLRCINSLPRTYFHLQKGNAAERLFYGKVQIEKCACYCYFRKGDDFRNLIHMSKYNGRRDLVRILAEYFSKELVLLNWFMDIETIIPVPIHYMRMIKRGYNQSEWLAKGISDITGITVEKRLLIKMSYNQTQTKKGHYERFENTCGVFNSRAHIAERYSNVLLVDDVLTSGSTLAACVDAIRKNSNMKISILTLGFAE